MEQESTPNPEELITTNDTQPHPVNQVTTVSKYLALVLFILLPFIGGYIGYVYAPEKVVEVEKIVVEEVEKTPADSMVRKIPNATVDMGEYKINLQAKEIEVTDQSGQILQTIPVDSDWFGKLPQNIPLLITGRDINYDHYLDVGVLSGGDYDQGNSVNPVNLLYDFYVWNAEIERLEKFSDFTSLTDKKFLTNEKEPWFVNPKFDVEQKTIYMERDLGGTAFRSQEYQFVDLRYELIDSAQWDSFIEFD